MPYDEHKLINLEMWETFYKELSDANARFIIGTGDQVYVDGEGAKQLNVWDWLKKVKQQKPSRMT
jgi:phosphodiesterase/alkaline phosphatase D-like protein